MERRRCIVFRLPDNGSTRRKNGQAIEDLEKIIRHDELGDDQPHADYGMFSYEL